MALFEYKVITSGKGGFASPVLLEKFLNDLGKEDWEIIEFRTQPENPLAFSGLARRPTQRDWTLEDAAAAAARTEVEKLRAEFAAKFKAGTSGGASGAEKGEEAAANDDNIHQDDSFRRPRDTERDLDPTATDDEAGGGTFELPEEEELPTFFDAIRPHMRRNQRGPGLSVSLEYLVKKFDMLEGDLVGALKECGLVIPSAENEPPAYVEYDSDLYWVNTNRQKQFFINTREKPRPMFRTVQAQRVGADAVEEAPVAELKFQPPAKAEAPSGSAPVAVPAGPELLDKLRPLMRRSRGGWSGSTSFLSRALKHSEAELNAAFASLGLRLPESGSGERAAQVELGDFVYWLNRDGRGNLWINACEKKENEPAATAEQAPVAPTAPSRESVPAVAAVSPGALAGVRLLLKETKTGAVAGKVDRLAEELGKSPGEFLATLTGAGLQVPEKAREKPVFVEHAGEIFWLNKNAKDELWLNAKASKFADKNDAAGSDDEKKSKRPRSKKKETA
ncbi:MAG TPA: hypothetical protein VNU49_04095 [Opitutaceae bacterium]|jgi:hypothetical protein|nr:hypothetical protein [Opitutaceae bacterium]